MANTLRTKICLVFSLLGLALLLSVFSAPQKAAAAGEEYMWTTNATVRVSGGNLSAPGELTFVSEQNGQNIFGGTLQHTSGCTINMQVAWGLGAAEFTTSVTGGSCSAAIKQGYDNQTITNIVEEDPDTGGLNEANVAVRFWGPDAIPKEGTPAAYIASPETVEFEIKSNGSVVFNGTGRKTATDQTIGTLVYTMGYYEINTGGLPGNLPVLRRGAAYELCPTSTTLITCMSFTVPAGYVSGEVLEVNRKPVPEGAGSCNKDAGGIGWIVCPMSSTLIKGAAGLDEEIVGLVLINGCRIFQNNAAMDARCSVNGDNAKEKEASAAMYKAHTVFRNLAYVLLVAIGLAMVISQIFGLEAFDAYTMRKMLPKLLIVTIIIPMLWPILRTVTLIANDSASAAMELIYAPFLEIGRTGGAGDLTSAILSGLLSTAGLLGAGIYLAIGGWGVVLALLATIFLTALQAFAVIMGRDLVFSGLVVVSAVPVAAAALPPIEAMFKLWWKLLRAIWLSIPTVAMVLAASKVGAAIALLTHPNLGYVFAIVVIAVGYSQFWKTLKSSDQIAAAIDNGVSKLTAGAKQGLSKYRSNTVKTRFGEGVDGQRKFIPGFGANKAAAFVDRLQAAGKPGGSFWNKNKRLTAEQKSIEQTAEKMVKEDANRWGGDDDTMEAIAKHRTREGAHTALSDRLMQRGRLAAKKKGVAFDENAERKKADTEAERRLNGAETTFQGQIGTHAMRVAATKALFASNTSLRKDAAIVGADGEVRTAKQRLEEGRKIVQELQKDGLMDNQQAAGIFTSNKGRERAASGFGAGMGYVAVDSEAETSEFLRGGIMGSGPGAYVGQRWEQLIAGAEEMPTMLADLGVDAAASQFAPTPEQREGAIDVLVSSGVDRNVATRQVDDEIKQQTRERAENQQRAAVQARGGLQAQIATGIEQTVRTRIATQLAAEGVTDPAVIQQRTDLAVQQQAEVIQQQASREADRQIMDQTLGVRQDSDEVTKLVEGIAALDALHKPTGQISRQSAESIKKILAAEYTFGGVTRTGEEWLRQVDTGGVPDWFAEKMRQARFSYGAQAEASRQTGAVVGGGQPMPPPAPGP